MSPGHFNVSDQRLIGDPQSAPAYEASFRITVDGDDAEFSRGRSNTSIRIRSKGELYEPLTVLPRGDGAVRSGAVGVYRRGEEGIRCDGAGPDGAWSSAGLGVNGCAGVVDTGWRGWSVGRPFLDGEAREHGNGGSFGGWCYSMRMAERIRRWSYGRLPMNISRGSTISEPATEKFMIAEHQDRGSSDRLYRGGG